MDVAIDDEELARRSIHNFAEMFAALGRGMGTEAVVRWPNAVGARLRQGFCHDFFSSVVVPSGTAPPVDDPGSYYVWTEAETVPGRVEDTKERLPVMGIKLDDPALQLEGPAANVEVPSSEELALSFDRTYGSENCAEILRRVQDPRVRLHGLRCDGKFVCFALTLSVADDLGVHMVVTEERYRRRGLASSLVKTLLVKGREQGMRSATLQATPEGFSVWKRLGFRRVGLIRAYVRLGSQNEMDT